MNLFTLSLVRALESVIPPLGRLPESEDDWIKLEKAILETIVTLLRGNGASEDLARRAAGNIVDRNIIRPLLYIVNSEFHSIKRAERLNNTLNPSDCPAHEKRTVIATSAPTTVPADEGEGR